MRAHWTDVYYTAVTSRAALDWGCGAGSTHRFDRSGVELVIVPRGLLAARRSFARQAQWDGDEILATELEQEPVTEEAGPCQPKSILMVVEQFWGCAWYRCHAPGLELRRRGHEVILSDRIPGPPELFDILVLQRPTVPMSLQAIERAKVAGRKVIIDMDDDLWNLHPTNPAYDDWNDPGTIGRLEWAIRAADVVTTATPHLAGRLKGFNDNVRVVPNMLPGEHWPPERKRPDRGGVVRIGWAGSPSHDIDMPILSGTVEQLLHEFDNVEVMMVGMEEFPFAPHPRLLTKDRVNIEGYAELLDEFDIGLAPLVDNTFNRAKSDLKFVEYAMIGIPTVASKVSSYENTIEPGVTGFLARNPKDWLKHLRRLVQDAELRERMGVAARAYAETRTVDKNIGNWEKAYGLC